jgi:hypothetical protein
MSNAQRQREFRERHPDYNRQYKARIRAQARAFREKLAEQAMRAEVLALIVRPMPLMLPAPVECPVLIEIEALRAKHRQAELVGVPLA